MTMKHFILNIVIFSVVSFLLLVIVIFTTNNIITSGDHFKIKKNSKRLVLGHSHPECAYNDSIIQNFESLAQSAESYFYTYIKLKKIVQSNNQVSTVFLEFTNYAIDDDWDKIYTWSDNVISKKYPKYSTIIETPDLFVLLKNNFSAVVNAQSVSLKNNLNFIKTKKINLPISCKWGGYYHLNRDKTDSLVTVLSSKKTLNVQQTDKLVSTNFKYIFKIIRFFKKNKTNNFSLKNVLNSLQTNKLASTNLKYLFKIIKLCKKHKVKLYLIRSPMHPKYPGLNNESYFLNFKETKLSNIEFLDFKDFPLKNSEFGDLNHLNHKGAKIYSEWFNTMLNKKGLLEKQDKQMFIDSEILLRRKENI